MLFDPETANDLKPWLVRTLEPICDAEPGALADYILALLKHNAPEAELRKELASELEEFLEKEGPTFLDTLFTALRTKSYLPYSTTTPSSGYPSTSTSVDTGIPIPLDALLAPNPPLSPERRRKRSIDRDDRDGHPPTKGSRLNNDGQFSRYGRNDHQRSSWGGRGARMGGIGRGDYMDGGIHSTMGMGMGNGMNASMSSSNGRGYQPPGNSRGICRDYHNNGYCARGAFCKYSHGDDAVVPQQLFPMNSMGISPLPFMPMMANGGMGMSMPGNANAAYDPHERIDMRPMQSSMGGRPPHTRAPIIPREGDTSGQKPGELPVIQDLTPQGPREDLPRQSNVNGHDAQDMVGSSSNGDIQMNGTNGFNGGMVGAVDTGLPQPPMMGRPPHRGGRGGGRGTFSGDAQSFRPEKRNDKTLVVEKIPEDRLSLGAVNEWFKRFGTVTNVAVDAMNAKALVSFSNHDEALAAWKSEDAVFGNRFVKVFWHRPLEGHGQVGQRMLAASASLVANISKDTTTPSGEASTPAPAAPATPAPPRKASTSAAAALAAKQKLLEQQIAEQKSLMALLTTASGQEKKNIMARLRKLGEEMKVPSPAAQLPLPPATSTASAPPLKKARSVTPRAEDKERLERERLDKELELHHAEGATEGEQEESTEELKAMLAKLKAEAASLGLTEAGDSSYGSSSYRLYRGRGRARVMRGGFRGAMRGGPPRGSMKLDLRPKKLLVKGVNGGAVQAVKAWYEATGQVESADTTNEGDIIVGFRTRAAAEQGLAKGANIPDVGQVQLSWYNNQQAGPSAAKSALLQPEESTGSNDAMPTEDLPSFPHDHEEPDEARLQEESTANGWGGDDAEDGFGML